MKAKIVVFSARKGGNCEHIAEYIRDYLRKSCEIFRFSEKCIVPCGDCRYECFAENGVCPHRTDGEVELLEGICRSDKTIFVVPNYCDFPCANFFIFNKRSNGFFQHHPERLEQYLNVPKKFIVVSNSKSSHFREAFVQHTDQEPEILFLSSRACDTVTTGNGLAQSETAQKMLYAFLK